MAEKTTRPKAAKKTEVKKKPASRAKPHVRTEFLLVQVASDAELVPHPRRKKAYTLTLRGLQPTVFFSNRPVRKAGHQSTKDFVANWAKGPNNFADDPPNAELVIFNPGKVPTAVTLVLSDPQWDPDRPNKLSYTGTFLGKGPRPSGIAWGSAALFIDDPSIEDEELMM